eukprot:SAG31_NODE_11190_length_1056_cov_1.467085_1_plen_85_part_00
MTTVKILCEPVPSGDTCYDESPDFEATVEDFMDEFEQRLNSMGDVDEFIENQEELMEMIVSGCFEAHNIGAFPSPRWTTIARQP